MNSTLSGYLFRQSSSDPWSLWRLLWGHTMTTTCYNNLNTSALCIQLIYIISYGVFLLSTHVQGASTHSTQKNKTILRYWLRHSPVTRDWFHTSLLVSVGLWIWTLLIMTGTWLGTCWSPLLVGLVDLDVGPWLKTNWSWPGTWPWPWFGTRGLGLGLWDSLVSWWFNVQV